ncbi:hypothetical protein FQA39_LY00224 [Lamprigera yunnana]|nr:hypothetical protein FQA39_LY00224 [Lamprigera yunnana]
MLSRKALITKYYIQLTNHLYYVRLSEANVHIVTILESVNLEYFFYRVIGNVNGNYGGTASNVAGIHERQCVGTP